MLVEAGAAADVVGGSLVVVSVPKAVEVDVGVVLVVGGEESGGCAVEEVVVVDDGWVVGVLVVGVVEDVVVVD